jgi:hypothetical protein
MDKTNQTLTQLKKMLLCYHFKMGFPAFSVVQ